MLVIVVCIGMVTVVVGTLWDVMWRWLTCDQIRGRMAPCLVTLLVGFVCGVAHSKCQDFHDSKREGRSEIKRE